MANEPISDAAIQNYFAALTAEEPVVTGQWFFKQNISLDGRHFVRCFFEECVLLMETAQFSLESCKFKASTFLFSPPAINAVKVSNLINASNGAYLNDKWSEIPQELKPIINSDGTVSI